MLGSHTRHHNSQDFLHEKHVLRGRGGLNPRPQALRITHREPLRPKSDLYPYKTFILILSSSDFEMSIWDPKRIQIKKFLIAKL